MPLSSKCIWNHDGVPCRAILHHVELQLEPVPEDSVNQDLNRTFANNLLPCNSSNCDREADQDLQWIFSFSNPRLFSYLPQVCLRFDLPKVNSTTSYSM
jgi:hypothetical protein